MTCGIYRIVNNINGKCYIGQSTNIQERLKGHYRNYRNYRNCTENEYSKFYEAIYEYDLVNFLTEILEVCEPEELNEKEIYYVKLYDSFNNGYNMTLGGGFCGGENHPSAKLKEEQVLEIKFMLKHSDKSSAEIGNLFGVHQNTISSINTGRNWGHVGNYIYPIRDNTIVNTCKICNTQILPESTLCISCHNKTRPLDNIRGEYNCSAKLTEDQVMQIKYLLKNSEKPQSKIAREFGVNKSTIGLINKGKYWRWLEEDKYKYPIRE